ncbi:MAG: dihydroorotase [Christensenellales bacterium]|jgi:dihydroorotase
MLKTLLENVYLYRNGCWSRQCVSIADGRIENISPNIIQSGFSKIYQLDGYYLSPGFTDVHTHLREPGFLMKETMATGTRAAARGGYTALCAMPNLSPVPDCRENLQVELCAIQKDAVVDVFPYGAITKGQKGEQLADLEGMAGDVIGFTDDGRGVQHEELMRQAMHEANRLDKLIAAHCEDDTLLRGGYIHDGAYAKAHGHRGISSESEWRQLARDLNLVRETDCRYHVCHVSTKESVALIRQAKEQGLRVSCETAPHYIALCDMDLEEHGRFKMNPPIRSKEDQEALIEGILNGTIDMIATDHAPHTQEEKSKGLAHSAMGVVGLECAFAILYSRLVKPNILRLESLIELLTTNPCRVFGLTDGGIEAGAEADLCVLDLDRTYKIDPRRFLSKGRATPFEGEEVSGDVILTLKNGKAVWKDEIFTA